MIDREKYAAVVRAHLAAETAREKLHAANEAYKAAKGDCEGVCFGGCEICVSCDEWADFYAMHINVLHEVERETND